MPHFAKELETVVNLEWLLWLRDVLEESRREADLLDDHSVGICSCAEIGAYDHVYDLIAECYGLVRCSGAFCEHYIEPTPTNTHIFRGDKLRMEPECWKYFNQVLG